ncbi:hypothetical protein NNJEOMEG_03469 [Fundidesulfovibrio magnetotacticus]|uniref:Xaa-Pro dipeptidyl-peptidase-like domain-containing protein n=1 Tax=Fundidesulfovibrio magnetotacticus TaxID=2730080 RepID=A0A6V8LYD2_9BACT|nr:alpha/beta fold hydrolase [Fundidesulfovibrio magnetotacticus]GFK95601.1 hypothetical protein NNJEOMEG_03469 [Fundidesulfovibrio magnetotacticus]
MILVRRVFILMLLMLWPVQALCGALVYEQTMLPARFGPERAPANLEALIVRPADQERHPLIVICHGTPRDRNERPSMTPLSRTREAEELARRGYCVLVFMRRAFGASGGDYAESSGKAEAPEYAASGRVAAQDIREAIRVMQEKPYVDPRKVVCVGASTGGFSVTALAADPPPGLIAAVSFAGGKGSSAPDTVNKPERLVQAFAEFGRTARIPMLFVYSENDHFFGPALARDIHRAFTSSGGKAELLIVPPFGEDGHYFFSRKGIPQWTPILDDFLARVGAPPRKPLLAVDRIQGTPPPNLSEKGRAMFGDYLDASPNKAFAMNPKGYMGWAGGKRTAEEAAAKALEFCGATGGQDCKVLRQDALPR